MIMIFKRWKLYLTILFILIFFFSLQQFKLVEKIFESDPLADKTIVIDPGHGGIDGGTSYNNLLEKDLNLEVGLKLRELLEARDNLTVIMTRNEDTALDHLNQYSRSRHQRDLMARIDIVNQEKVDLFISLHVDARTGQPEMQGPTVLYYPRHRENQKLAEILQKYLNQIDYPNFNPPSHQARQRDFYILKAKNTPGVIVELGFITNHLNRKLLQQDSYQQALAKAIYEGVEEYFSSFSFLTGSF
ncbi:N-acetylmuramoyl-L-alanine amidase [Natroniella sulfidigena]|uniref:N-acetylmuramoyl-L-alanine amidase family protein n=1 Tax=Natroniella sulfidigena TaxID=723921 RepID=UPI00200B5612|nr:N-acetylmuramoyl-L-alanine amidase [Natroniella sulfidigena]MCK8817241.1 N-acetylmuramoyl-L-alanine amidase [Natroniella sulfidigena]